MDGIRLVNELLNATSIVVFAPAERCPVARTVKGDAIWAWHDPPAPGAALTTIVRLAAWPQSTLPKSTRAGDTA